MMFNFWIILLAIAGRLQTILSEKSRAHVLPQPQIPASLTDSYKTIDIVIFDFQVVPRPGDNYGNEDGLSRQCSLTAELTEAERMNMFGSCPSANSLEDALERINLVTANDANEPMRIQFQEDTNSHRLAQRNDTCLRLILQGVNAEKQPDQNPLRDLEIRKANAIAQKEDAVAMWGL